FTQCTPCGPARASLLTGLYLMNHRSGRNGTPLDARHSNVALEVRKAGYEPMLFGYSDTSPDPRGLAADDPRLLTYEGVLPGFSVGCQLPESMDRWRESLAAKGYTLPERALDVYKPVGKSTAPDGSARPKPLYRAEDSDSAFLAERVIDYLDRQGETPWFVHAVFLRPHPPLIAPEPYNGLYALDDVPPPRRLATVEDEAAQHPYLDYLFERQRKPGYMMGEQRDLQALSDRAIAALRATYYGLITEVDAQIGRLVAYLKARGLYERTLIVFTVDHGELLGDHWLWGKEGYFDQAFHIPLIVRDPSPEGRAACGHRVAAFTEAIDVMPTILDWLGREVPAACDGASLLPLLRGGTPRNWRREAHWEFDFREPATLAAERHFGLSSDQCNLAVLRGRRFKYVHFVALPPLLFDLQA
ncbi:MAG: alkaline phosphatase family protein, partial [Burkholderiales bacterium]